MSHKKKHGYPVPPANQSKGAPSVKGSGENNGLGAGEIGNQEHDPKRRLGDYEGKGEHSLQEPGGKNGANH